ncbi:MAG TPA: hypothetical protein VFK30_12940, partial [Anaerolineae bacterium]|nr:hypothetical protein [Anaerolineae bacterium]
PTQTSTPTITPSPTPTQPPVLIVSSRAANLFWIAIGIVLGAIGLAAILLRLMPKGPPDTADLRESTPIDRL